MKVEVRAVALLVLLAVATVPLQATAQEPALEPETSEDAVFGIRITNDTTWEDGASFRDVNYTLENATLTIRGARVTLDNVTLRTRPNSTLILESLPGRPAIVQGGAQGWDLRGGGRLIVKGLPGDEALFTGVRGQSGFALGSTALFLGGVGVGNTTLEISHLKLRNYSSGMLLANDARGSIDHLDVEGSAGIALAMTESNVSLRDSTFRGQGGTVFISVPPGPVRVENLSFFDVGTGLTLRGTISEVVDLRVRNATTCLSTVGFNHVVIRGFTCEEFENAAIATSTTATGRTSNARLDITGMRASASEPVSAGILATNSLGLKMRDSVLGPMTGPAILSQRILPDLEGVTFQGIKDFNVVYVNPPENATFTLPGMGEPGSKGWLRVIRQSPFRIVDETGAPVAGTRFDVTAEDTGVLAFSNQSLEDGYVVPSLETFAIDRRGEARSITFRIDVGNATAGTTLEGYVPTNNETRLVLVQGSVPEFKEKRSPLPGAAVLLVAVALVALATRRQR